MRKPGTSPELLAKARSLRANPTEAERRLWQRLRARQLDGMRFRRQVPVGHYVADFLCAELRLIVEVDGGQHARSEGDARREGWLGRQGYRVLRFWNNEVIENMEGVLQSIRAGRDGRHPHPGPPPEGEGTPAAPPARATGVERGGTGGDRVTLRYEQRYRRRGILTTEQGEEILLDLAEATELQDGDMLVLEDGRRIGIRAAAEPLAEVRAEGAVLARLAWHVGNRHTPAQVGEGRLLIQRDHVLEDMLRALGATVAHVEEAFRPEGGAYGHGRTHGHHHHGAHDDPNAHIPHRHG